MRPLRFLLSLLLGLLTFILLINARFGAQSPPKAVTDDRASFGAYFSWHTPSSLFPPSAIISLTDDNSTFFLARPAAFGPLLASKGLSAPLWVGSGFSDEHLGRAGDGELGCSDIPDWDDGLNWSGKKTTGDNKGGSSKKTDDKVKRSAPTIEEELEEPDTEIVPSEDDGTDDHLHHHLTPSGQTSSKTTTSKPAHADIQSLQEGAEIAGKAVLLSRGGCGFLEKVKWVQRRGGVALIVGDDVRGGALVTMYAHGDTSNVTIPSVFTSHTTAHLLSSLIPSGGSSNVPTEDPTRLGLAAGDKSAKKPQSNEDHDSSNKETKSKSRPVDQAKGVKVPITTAKTERKGWFSSMFGGRSARQSDHDASTRLIQEVLVDDKLKKKKPNPKNKAMTTSSSVTQTKTPTPGLTDWFVIGVQDWRDPDMVADQRERVLGTVTTSSTLAAEATQNAGTKGHGKAAHEAVDLGHNSKAASGEASSGWFGGVSSSADKDDVSAAGRKGSKHSGDQKQPGTGDGKEDEPSQPHHDGLWVTLTPTSMSTSPFFDTLLVLVVSPLVTLTVVYALLVLRSRIRRRRWRAPKSVVERLPVRTYQTMPSTTPTSAASSASTPSIDATTPLLPSSARAISSRPRPRSRTASEVPLQSQGSPSRSGDEMASPSLDQIEEKRASGLAEWRRRYGGKQRECVVCLEEYVDGVSRVMSLPCGHEFHAECITPWLTTRRRTCPICKGDVVRSLARSSNSAGGSAPGLQGYFGGRVDEEDEDDVQEQAASTRNDDPSATRPVSREDEAFEDLERGFPDRTR